MAASTYRFWERKDMGIRRKKEKIPFFRDQISKFSKKIKKFSMQALFPGALWSYPGDDFATRERKADG